MAESVYESDPDAAPDSGFIRGELAHLVAGNRGRLLDPRRTPVHITCVSPETGFFEVEIEAFEDAGARWLIPLESVASYQFAHGSDTIGGAELAALRAAVARCDVQITITGGPAARDSTQHRLLDECAQASRWLTEHGAPSDFDPQPFIETSSGWPQAQEWLAGYLGHRSLDDIEEAIASAYVSNPWAGDLVLGHLIVLAELGLGVLTARAPRDPAIFDRPWSRLRRTEHILARMGFAQALWSRARCEPMLYRGVAIQNRLAAEGATDRPQSPLVSASFSRQVAESHFLASNAVAATLYRQRLAPEQLFMTFLETEAMNRQFPEAEAVMLADAQHFPSITT